MPTRRTGKRKTKAKASKSLLEEFGGIIGFRKQIATLKRKGILAKSTPTRKAEPKGLLLKLVRTFRPVAEKTSVARKVRSKKEADALKAAGYTVRETRDKPPGAKKATVRRVVVLTPDERVSRTKKGGTRVVNRFPTVEATTRGPQDIDALAQAAFAELKPGDQIGVRIFGNRAYALAQDATGLRNLLADYGGNDLLEQGEDAFGNAPASFFVIAPKQYDAFLQAADRQRKAVEQRRYQRRRAFQKMMRQRRG